jgi:putative transposase
MAVNPAYTSQLLSYRDELVFTDPSGSQSPAEGDPPAALSHCGIREYWDEKESLWVDRDVNAAINLKRVGLELFPTIKRRRGNPVVTSSTINSTSFAQRLPLGEGSSGNIKMCQKPTLPQAVSVGSSLFLSSFISRQRIFANS